MAIVNLLELEVNKVSTDIKDYSLMITAPSSFGKSPFLAELYGKSALFLGFENSYKGIAGVHTVGIDSYTTLEAYVAQLENPQLREKFDVVVIDTLFLFDQSIENSITSAYGKDLLSECKHYNQAYKIVDKRFLTIIKRIQRMNYTLVYVCHPVEKKVKLPNGQEIVRIEPQVSERIKSLLLPEIDIKLIGTYDEAGNKVLYTQGTPYFDARVRGAEMDMIVPFDAVALKTAFAEGVARKHKGNEDLLTDQLESKNVANTKVRTFPEAMGELLALGEELGKEGLGAEANLIVAQELGLDNDGNQRTLQQLSDVNIDAVETIVVKLKALKEKSAQ